MAKSRTAVQSRRFHPTTRKTLPNSEGPVRLAKSRLIAVGRPYSVLRVLEDEKVPDMLKGLMTPRLVLTVFDIFNSRPCSNPASTIKNSATNRNADEPEVSPCRPAPVDYDGWGRPITARAKSQKLAPAPRHDISGTWDPANGPDDGGQFLGAKALPEDGEPGHQPPYTAAGLEALYRTKPSNAARIVLPGETNDPELFYPSLESFLDSRV